MHCVSTAVLALSLMLAVTAPAAGQGSGGSTGATKRSTRHASSAKRASSARAKSATPKRSAADSTPPGTKVNEYMSYDAAKKTVTLQVNAAEGSINGGMNFNGGARGDQTITIPVGWTVHMSFLNKDAIPHSAIIIADTKPLPAIPQDPAMAGAYTSHVSDGLPTNGTDQSTFKTSKPGNYLLVCGVPGHAPSGMYVNFVVSADATAPSYKT
jgi:sulfocyanin